MRQINFRVWDKRKKVFIPNDVYALIQTDFKAFGVMTKDWENYKEGEYFYENAQEVSLWSGIHDKNGKEIYEGDILYHERHKVKYIMKWVAEFACFSGETIDEIVKEEYNYYQFSHEKAISIIGNIYEHPQLIKQMKNIREIKFRVWDGENMSYQDSNGLFIVFHCQKYPEEQGDSFLAFKKEALSVMQFTGIIDWKGVEIYEHDIIRFNYFYKGMGGNMGVTENEHELTGVVVWYEHGWGLDQIVGKHWQEYTGYAPHEGKAKLIAIWAMNEGEIHDESFLKIGNIYETPELNGK